MSRSYQQQEEADTRSIILSTMQRGFLFLFNVRTTYFPDF